MNVSKDYDYGVANKETYFPCLKKRKPYTTTLLIQQIISATKSIFVLIKNYNSVFNYHSFTD